MVMSRGRFWRNQSGATMVEAAIAMPVLLTLLLGFVDFGYAFYQWNAGNKAVQAGARLAQISAPIASGLLLEAKTPSDPLDVGKAVPANTYSYICTASAAGAVSCSCGTGATCQNLNVSQAAFDFIFSGSSSRPGMLTFLPTLLKSEVQIQYQASGLGYWTRPSGPVPTITVSIVNHPFQFFFLAGFLGFGTITMPSMLSTVTGEDMKSTYP
ncbi:pilus assembly protein [Mesorhizobium sp. M00.F.Ca.ET.151.01.1.1]|uniref:TadE/TadG family type IV pilus assembly protein n=1 Tax=unclassified Mesorhizobium TaxID=325217 RepID=UPI000FD6ED08|nr:MULTISPECIES: TadE/TadG family type IV pilus assembly protein [unclassified Mesorhizobium]TGR44361.1 pilus assembly protein [bacterium M00.F.Ca.ET.199.01.1.1]TGU33227.1 pilus assembly protein [bacterium M00.F.Ca.ET.156.01.1.1]TGU94398.1 pilus assembly protein [Mesorhizobium sp. M00.F.Ca.ET.151.01.1.1]TGV87432.1 pilus assembly protein [Mesorhizobium sp. M00.F.Ca.ET.149.01.1.1]TIU49692.1 MAG: pilus assembly protein [Mesorhizobium sp.]